MKRFFISVLIITACLFQSYAQVNTSWFGLKEVDKNVWQIDDHKDANVYLIAGKDSALVVDTGMGNADLAALIAKLTDKPLIVVNTHGHRDHTGANFQFGKIYIHPADSAAARRANATTRRTNGMGDVPLKEELYTGKPFNTRLVAVHEGHIFNLGDRRLEVMETPGHTAGSICLLDKENKLLFSGDNNNVIVWLFLQGCSPLHDYLKTLEKQRTRIAEFTTLFPGHVTPLPDTFIDDQITCIKAILDGTGESKEYNSSAGKAMVSYFGQAGVAYDPNNL